MCFTVEAVCYEAACSAVPTAVRPRSCDGAGREEVLPRTGVLSPPPGREEHSFAPYVSTGTEQAQMIC